jgi:hypothetical protein
VAESEARAATGAGIVAESESRPATWAELVTCAGRSALLSHRVLRGRERFGAAWQQLVPWRATAGLREYGNLIWLRDRLFQTPRPLASGTLTRHGMPCFGFLLTEVIPGAITLDELLRGDPRRDESRGSSSPSSPRVEILGELAREVARMHALRFVHGNLTPATVLVGPPSRTSRVHLTTDARGGPRSSPSAWVRELARFAVCAESSLTEAESRSLAAIYVEERRAQGRPVDAERLDREMQAQRSALA